MAKSKKNSKIQKEKEETPPSDDDGNIQDERFQKAQTHPQFQKLHTRRKQEDGEDGNLIQLQQKEKHGHGEEGVDVDVDLEADDRFKAMLTDSRFALGGDVGLAEGGIDKYGFKQKQKKDKKKKKEGDDPAASGTDDDSDGGESGGDSDGEKGVNEDPASRIAFLTALSRGEVDVSSSSEDDSSSGEEYDDRDHSSDDDSIGSVDGAGLLDPHAKFASIDPEPEITFDDSKFLAVCNMDWGSVRAVDLFAITSSFAPPGSVKYVRVYPSDFGMERMNNDVTLGPQGIWKKKSAYSDTDDDDSDSGSGSDGEDENLGHNAKESEGNNGSDKEENEENDPSESDDNNSASENEGSEDDEDEDEIDEDELLKETYKHFDTNPTSSTNDDFDAEKLRAYEMSKMKYFFAVVEFTSSGAADAAYKELDDMEIGHSSANIDLRAIPETDVEGVVEGRTLRDQAFSIPSNYAPPDFVVAALQQTAVKCTWEEGDKERERLLTQYGVGNDAWQAMTNGDDLRAYLASGSSDEESDDNDGDNGNKKGKAKNMRALLGLGGSDGSDDEAKDGNSDASDREGEDDDSFFGQGNLDSDSDDDGDGGDVKQATFIPGKGSLEDKIRSKLKEKEEGTSELTPWEKFQEKRKSKRKERKRVNKQQKSLLRGEDGEDDPFAPTTKKTSGKSTDHAAKPSTKEELDLLLAGDDDEEAAKDYHMRDLVRIEKNKSKKLKGARKRKEAEIKNNAVGMEFKLDTKDNRFASLLDGSDDRFGIDRTDPQYKETPAMRDILAEQTKRRKSKKRARPSENTDVSAEAMMTGKAESSGALALSSLVKNLKSKVAKSSN